jgi:CheY-like chemotaxis protein
MSTAQILLVEDERIIAADIRRCLTRLGYTVLATVSSGPAAIATAHALNPTLVLMDVKLEGAMDGVEAGEYIESHWHIPVVYMTAYPEEEALRARHTEPLLYIRKPFHEDTVQAVLEQALGRRSLGCP